MHVVLDLYRFGREWMIRHDKGKGKEVDDGVLNQGEQEWRAKWRRGMVTNMAWLPLTIHWGLEKGLVSELGVGLLGSIAGASSTMELWKQSGKL